MFTGLIEEIGEVRAVRPRAHSREFTIGARQTVEGARVDDSICLNGVCLTIAALAPQSFTVQAVDETLRKTTLGNLQPGSPANLERALRLSDRLGGHLVQGHVEGVATVVAVEPQESGRLLHVVLPAPLLRYVVPQGSIALEGVSLTVARLQGDRVTVALIPHTLARTTLGACRAGAALNVETDLVGKYVERLLAWSGSSGVSAGKLAQWGYTAAQDQSLSDYS